MKLAIIAALAQDRRSGVVLGGVVPASEAIATVKAAIASGKAPDPRFPVLVAFALDSKLREHKFHAASPEEIAAFGVPVEGDDQTNAAIVAAARLSEELKALQEQYNFILAEKVRFEDAACKAEAEAFRLKSLLPASEAGSIEIPSATLPTANGVQTPVPGADSPESSPPASSGVGDGDGSPAPGLGSLASAAKAAAKGAKPAPKGG